MKILVAEDEPSIAESYKLFLESIGHEVILTQDGEQCLDIYMQEYTRSGKNRNSDAGSTSPFDLIVLDYRMPKKDGVQVAIQIRSIVPSQRILLASAYAHDLSIMELHRNIATHSIEIIQKPFEFDQLLRIVEKGKNEAVFRNSTKNPVHNQQDDANSHRSSTTITWLGAFTKEDGTQDNQENDFLNTASFAESMFRAWD